MSRSKPWSRRSMGSAFIIFTTIMSSLIQQSTAILPTAAIDVVVPGSDDTAAVAHTLLASQGSFAPSMPMTPDTNPRMIPLFPPQEDSFLCSDIDSDHASNPNIDQPFVFVVPRGSCTFEHKALIAQMYGASGVIIHGTLSARYGFNETTHTIDYPLEYYDYDCSVTKGGGKIFIPTSKLIDINDGTQNKDQSNPMTPYNSANDYLLSGTKANGNLCAIYASGNNFESGCSSQRCLLTGNETVTSSGESMMEACCAWDTHVYLYRDGSMADPKTGQAYHPISIPAYFITMEEASSLIDSIKSNSAVYITMYTRWYPQYNLSTIVIWAVGVFVAAIASYLSASEIRFTRKRLEKRRKEHEDGSAQTDSHNGDTRTNASAVSMRGYERVVSNEGEESEYRRPIAPEETLELEPAHALFFIVFSSAGLLTLFFFKIYNVVKLFYAFGCSGAIMQIIVIPFYFHIARKLNFRDRVAFTTQLSESGSVTVIEALAIATSYGVGAVWIYIAFTVRHPETLAFFWIMQDIMGACMCILFLQTMKLNSIKVASMLLTAAFFYDIFFVFVTPYLTKGGKSIMVDVATSGGPPTADPSWCEKYPDGQECKGGDPLPMLFTIPRINDYSGGTSLLGLGDIVLPGLLLSFASRYDEAKKLIGASHSPRNSNRLSQETCSKNVGYFIPAVIAYGVGLAMANIAVYVMQMGQPALLYLVPCCLGTIVFLGWKRGELLDLWQTPKVLASCDDIMYGPQETPTLTPTPTESQNEHDNDEDSARLELS